MRSQIICEANSVGLINMEGTVTIPRRAAIRDKQNNTNLESETPVTDSLIQDCQTQPEQLLRELQQLETSYKTIRFIKRKNADK